MDTGGRCPLTIAAALGRGDFESGSDSKSRLYREGGCAQFSSRCAAVVAACAFCWCGGRCPLTIAAALGRAVPANDCCCAWSGGARRRLLLRLVGRCPLTIAAALGRGDFESGSDSKSRLYREGGCAQFSSRCAAVVAACAFCWCGRRCSLAIAAALGRDDFESGSDSKSRLCGKRMYSIPYRSLFWKRFLK